MHPIQYRSTVSLLALGVLAIALAGCGGGGSSPSGAVTRATRDRVQLIQTQNIRLLAHNGGQSLGVASLRNGAFVNGTVAVASAGGGGASASASAVAAPLPLLGSFIQNVAAVPRPHRAAARSRLPSRDVTPDPNFYFDEFLGLWVQFTDTPTQTTYLLFVDQAKTQPAGSIVTTFPAADADPQVFSSTYTFTAGLLSGSHGKYTTTIFSDGSGSSSYEDSSPDGWSDNGQSSWRVNGDYTWSSHTTAPGGISSNDRGTFHADGSGFTHSDASDGFVSDFTYRADGSGFGRINGPSAGLPATIVWDSQGNTTITYADGTVDRFNAWFFGGTGGGVAIPVDAGGGTGASTSVSN